MVDISIVGAAGEVGRALATHLLRGELIGPSERLQLVGHGREAASERKLLAERCDLLDAFDETAPSIQIASTLEEVAGDIIVLAAGATISGAGVSLLPQTGPFLKLLAQRLPEPELARSS
jgi:malate dehydrogenase